MTKAFLQLANLSITASYLILGVLLLRVLLRKVPKNLTLWLWALVGVRLALPFSLESAFSLVPKGQPIPADIALSPAPAIDSGIPVINQAINPVIAQNFTPEPVASVNPLQVILPILAAAWVLGVALMGLYALVSFLRLRKRVGVSLRLRDNVYLCDHIPTPFLLGLVRPKIYLPSDLEPRYQEAVLRHEYAHLRHHDNWWKVLGFLLLSVYWFHPLVWVSYVLFCRDLEMACDERAVNGLTEEARRDYSYALLACAAPKRTIFVCPVAFGENGIKSRIRNVLRFKKATVWGTALVFLIGAITAVCFLTNPREEVIPEETTVPTQAQEDTGLQDTELPKIFFLFTSPEPSPGLDGVVFEDLDGDYTYENGALTLLFHNVTKVAQTTQYEDGRAFEQTILLKTPDTTMEIRNPDVNTPWSLYEFTGRENSITIADQTGQVPLVCNEYWLRHAVSGTPFLRLVSRITQSPGELLSQSPSPYPPTEAELTYAQSELAFRDVDGEFTYENGSLSLLFRNVSQMGSRTLRDRNGEAYTQTILLKDFATTMELSNAHMDGSQWAWRVSETSGTEEPVTVTDQMSRRVFSNNEYYMQDLLTGRTVLLLKRAARLTETDGALRPKTAQAALAIDRNTGETLYAWQADQKIPTGIQNKLALALTVLEEHAPEELVDVTGLPAYLLKGPYTYLHDVSGTSYLEDVKEMTVEELLTLLLLQSSQDPGYPLARLAAGSEEAMVAKMNEYVGQFCRDTSFTDVYGVAQGQYTTARDTLLLVNRVLENPCLANIWAKTELALHYPTSGEETVCGSSNYLLGMSIIPDYYDSRVTGGFARTFNLVDDLVCTAQQGDRNILCLVLGGQREVDEAKTWMCTYYAGLEETAALLNTVLD